MDARRCSVDGCERPPVARGWCSMHYSRWARTGTVERTGRYVCVICGTPNRVMDGWKGSGAKTCPGTCRDEYNRRRHRVVGGSGPFPTHCIDCGVELPSRLGIGPGNHGTRRCPEHRAAHEAQRLAAKEYRRRMRRHGISVEQYDAVLASQGDGCAICGTTTPNGRGTWHIDHDHDHCPGVWGCAECFRGLLCHNCNVLIGHAGEDPQVLAAAARYLTK